MRPSCPVTPAGVYRNDRRLVQSGSVVQYEDPAGVGMKASGCREMVNCGRLRRSPCRVGRATVSDAGLGVPPLSDGAGDAAAVFTPDMAACLRLRLEEPPLGTTSGMIAGDASRGE